MSELHISDYFFGDSDGKNEATYNTDFIKYYYDGFWYYKKLLEPKRWLILWRKWTGKSLLWWYFHKNLDPKTNFSRVVSYRDFRFDTLGRLSSWDIKPNQYIWIWKFLLLIELWKEIINDLSLEGNTIHANLKNFITRNFNLGLNQNRILEVIQNKELTWTLPVISGGWSREEKLTSWSYLDYIDNLQAIILELVQESKNNFYIILDELDDRFRRNDENKDILISLIKAIQSINWLLYNMDGKSKIITLLRTDIFTFLRDTDIQKFKDDHGVELNWESKIDVDSQLLQMLVYKIGKSDSEYSSMKYIDAFNKLFPQSIQNSKGEYIHPAKFLLERTFFRPRDVISYLKKIVDKYPNTKFIWWKAFIDAEKEYSKYLLWEVENELIWHYSDDYITDAFRLLKQFNKPKFTLHELRAYLNNNINRFPNINQIESFLETFYNFWILWNSWNGINNFVWYSTVNRDDRAEVDFKKDFIIHLWLRKALLN